MGYPMGAPTVLCTIGTIRGQRSLNGLHDTPAPQLTEYARIHFPYHLLLLPPPQTNSDAHWVFWTKGWAGNVCRSYGSRRCHSL